MTLQKRILLIDHDPGASGRMRDALERTGRFCVREEHNEHTAARAAHFFQPDLVLLDFMTSALDAQAIASELPANTPVICMASLASSDEVASAGVFGGYTFFAGPVSIAEFLRGIDELLCAAR